MSKRTPSNVLHGTGQYLIERTAAGGIDVTFHPQWFRCRSEPDRTAVRSFEAGAEADAFEKKLDDALAIDANAGMYKVAVAELLSQEVPEAEVEQEPSGFGM